MNNSNNNEKILILDSALSSITTRDTWLLNLATRICLILGSLDNIFVLKFFF